MLVCLNRAKLSQDTNNHNEIKRESPVCFYCEKRGHYARDCRKKKSDLAKKKDASSLLLSNEDTTNNLDDQNDDLEDGVLRPLVLALASYTLGVHDETAWVCDSELPAALPTMKVSAWTLQIALFKLPLLAS